jgi:hypothetical protein
MEDRLQLAEIKVQVAERESSVYAVEAMLGGGSSSASASSNTTNNKVREDVDRQGPAPDSCADASNHAINHTGRETTIAQTEVKEAAEGGAVDAEEVKGAQEEEPGVEKVEEAEEAKEVEKAGEAEEAKEAKGVTEESGEVARAKRSMVERQAQRREQEHLEELHHSAREWQRVWRGHRLRRRLGALASLSKFKKAALARWRRWTAARLLQSHARRMGGASITAGLRAERAKELELLLKQVYSTPLSTPLWSHYPPVYSVTLVRRGEEAPSGRSASGRSVSAAKGGSTSGYCGMLWSGAPSAGSGGGLILGKQGWERQRKTGHASSIAGSSGGLTIPTPMIPMHGLLLAKLSARTSHASWRSALASAGGKAAALARGVHAKREAEESARGEQKERAWLLQEAEGAALARREGDQRVAAHKKRRAERSQEEQKAEKGRTTKRAEEQAVAVNETKSSANTDSKQPRRAGRFAAAAGILGRLGGRR